MIRSIAVFPPLLIAFFTSSCGESNSSNTSGGESDRRDGSLSKLYPEWKAAPDSDHGRKQKDYDPILHGIVRKRYSNLDPFVERWEESYRDGTKVKEVFLNCFESYHRIGGSNAGKWFPTYEENMKEWIELKPESAAPYLAMAGIIYSQAWLSRGSDWAENVTEEGWKGFETHLDRSHKFLDKAPAFVKEDAHYYYQLLGIGLGKGAEFEDMLEVFQEGQKRDPLYLPLYEQTTWYLRPRWYGENHDDWHKFLLSAVEHEGLSAEDKKMVYGVMVRKNIQNDGNYRQSPEKFLRLMDIDVPTFLEGLSIFVKRNPDSTAWPLRYFFHAEKAGDIEAMKEAITLADRTYDPYVYEGPELLEFFENAVSKFPELAEPLGRNGK